MNTNSTERIDRFWSWFSASADRLRAIRSAEDSAYLELEEQVLRIHKGLGAEVGGSDDSEETSLVITAYGDDELFSLVDEIVARAPRIPAWRIIGLKPPLLEALEVQHDGGVLRTQDLQFRVLEENAQSGKIVIEVAVRSDTGSDSKSREDATLLALSSFVGERIFARKLLVSKIVASPENSADEKYAPIGKLAAILGIH